MTEKHYWIIGAIVLYLLYSNGFFKTTTAAGASATT